MPMLSHLNTSNDEENNIIDHVFEVQRQEKETLQACKAWSIPPEVFASIAGEIDKNVAELSRLDQSHLQDNVGEMDLAEEMFDGLKGLIQGSVIPNKNNLLS